MLTLQNVQDRLRSNNYIPHHSALPGEVEWLTSELTAAEEAIEAAKAAVTAFTGAKYTTVKKNRPVPVEISDMVEICRHANVDVHGMIDTKDSLLGELKGQLNAVRTQQTELLTKISAAPKGSQERQRLNTLNRELQGSNSVLQRVLQDVTDAFRRNTVYRQVDVEVPTREYQAVLAEVDNTRYYKQRLLDLQEQIIPVPADKETEYRELMARFEALVGEVRRASNELQSTRQGRILVEEMMGNIFPHMYDDTAAEAFLS